MTLKEELEILRGEPIQVFTGDPMDIPCIETSDPEELCKHPVVSVHMITYNHESYIRQAIEGVMMQKTDFEFELVIGEDASTDKTREICFEYQKRYPDKIRVLWWHENLYRNSHPAGGNGARTSAHCRGEFIAFCEGDDCWVEPTKLQKQVDVMRKYPNVGLCFTDAISVSMTSDWKQKWHDYPFAPWFPEGKPVPGEAIARMFCLGKPELKLKNSLPFCLTASAMVRKATLNAAYEKYDIFSWQLTLGDLIIWLGVTSLSTVVYVPIFAVERHVLPTGAQSSSGGKVFLDGFLVRYYFARKNWGMMFSELPVVLRNSYFMQILSCYKYRASRNVRLFAKNLLRFSPIRKSLINPLVFVQIIILRMGALNALSSRILNRIWHEVI